LATVPKSYADLKQLCENKFKNKIPPNPCFKYKDSDNELIILSNDEDLETALLTSEEENIKTLRIFIFPNEDTSQKDIALEKDKKNSVKEGMVKDHEKTIAMDFETIPLAKSTNMRRHIVSEPTGNLEEEEEIRMLSEAIPQGPISSMKRSISQPGKKDAEYSNLGSDTGKYRVFDFNMNSGFNDEQLKVLNEIIEKKVKQIVEYKIQTVASDIISHAAEEIKKKRMGGVANSRITSPMPGSGRPSISRIRAPEVETFSCDRCGVKIEGIRYSCTVCKNFDYCENCESKGEHPHPFIKYRLPAKSPDLNSCNEQEFRFFSYPPNHKPFNRKMPSPALEKYANRNQDQIGAPVSSNSSQSTPYHTPGYKDKRYSAKITKEPLYDVIKTKTNHPYSVIFTIKNSGENKWPDDTRLICSSGVHNGTEEKVPALEPGKEYTVTLDLIAPAETGKYVSQWRLHHGSQEGLRAFGSNLFFEIHVMEDKTVNRDEFIIKSDSSLTDDDARLIQELKCTKQTLDKAKVLNDLFPNGGLREKIQFVTNCPISLDIDDLVGHYMEMVSGRRKSQAKPNN